MDVPTLTLLVPATLDVEPEGQAELRRHLSDEYRATVSIRPSRSALPCIIRLYAGEWPPGVDDELRPLVEAAFYTLDWLDLDEAL